MDIININNYRIKIFKHDALVVGTGCAGFNAANQLKKLGLEDVVIVTENIYAGTSRNTGSDKQTYYKLSLSGGELDSVNMMAGTLYDGKAIDGSIALAEAATSVQGFMNLVEIGVPFPKNKYGGFVGYKTDHDPVQRGTSIGPLTSKQMTVALEKEAEKLNVQIYNRFLVIKILKKNDKFIGVLCLDTDEKNKDDIYKIILAKKAIYATGGPAGIYKDSVYPNGHWGMSGIAFEAGVKGRNLTEWQYGLASLKPRWNVSGTYMQVLPRFVSTDNNGNDEREFLREYFDDDYDCLNNIFLKGYQWPFDIRKAHNGSSIIDIIVYIETKLRNRRVFLDFTKDPFMKEIDFDKLNNESYEYLKKADALIDTPINRLIQMNLPAYEFYLNKNIDLRKEYLEIGLCAQHNNGGLAINEWWHTNIDGLYACGEVAGSHGVYRPGGSALNSGQVGSKRASEHLFMNMDKTEIGEINIEDLDIIKEFENIICDESNILELIEKSQQKMSEVGGPIRNYEEIEKYISILKNNLSEFFSIVRIKDIKEYKLAYRFKDLLISQLVYLESIINYIEKGGLSRGSSLYTDKNGEKPIINIDDIFKYILDKGKLDDLIQEVKIIDSEIQFTWREREPLEFGDDFFENVWKGYRDNKNIY